MKVAALFVWALYCASSTAYKSPRVVRRSRPTGESPLNELNGSFDPSTTGESTTVEDEDVYNVHCAIIRGTNEERARHRKPALMGNKRLDESADTECQALLRVKFLSHTADGTTPGDRAKREGYQWSAIAENIYSESYSMGMSTERPIRGWINSSGHHKNMLGDFNSMGSAACDDGQNRYFVQVFGKSDQLDMQYSCESKKSVPTVVVPYVPPVTPTPTATPTPTPTPTPVHNVYGVNAYKDTTHQVYGGGKYHGDVEQGHTNSTTTTPDNNNGTDSSTNSTMNGNNGTTTQNTTVDTTSTTTSTTQSTLSPTSSPSVLPSNHASRTASGSYAILTCILVVASSVFII